MRAHAVARLMIYNESRDMASVSAWPVSLEGISTAII